MEVAAVSVAVRRWEPPRTPPPSANSLGRGAHTSGSYVPIRMYQELADRVQVKPSHHQWGSIPEVAFQSVFLIPFLKCAPEVRPQKT